MKTAVMQPYFLPYLSYWQLIAAADCFVILDDVNFIKRGYINRNRILINGEPYLFSIPVQDASQNRLIMDTRLKFENRDRKKFLARVENSYRRAPHFESVMPLIKRIVEYETDDLTEYIRNSLKECMFCLDIRTEVLKSSGMEKDNSCTGADRIVEICRCLSSDIYINPSGGRILYRKEMFEKYGIDLYFLETDFEKVKYRQFGSGFIERLSIIDVLMFNSVDEVRNMLKIYDLKE